MKIQMESEKGIDWIALLSENTEVDLRTLNDVVQKKTLKPLTESLFFGRALKDKDPTIIHHFDSGSRLLYPDLEAGIFLSRKLVYDLWEILMREEDNLRQNKAFPGRNLVIGVTFHPVYLDFNIDPAYEFAKFLNIEANVQMQNIAEICTKKAPGCMTFARREYFCVKNNDQHSIDEVLQDSLVAVKTCTKFHDERLEVVMKTWGGLVPNIELISDSEEEKFQTKVLPYTINTENGHCNKTMAILEYFDQLETATGDPLSFLVIVDDDTIFSVVRLAQLLACYDRTESFLLGGVV